MTIFTPEPDDIEITPEMIEAGESVLCSFETETADERYWARTRLRRS